ncbi:At2g23090 like protein [Gautieria morchelliformis]|nr:At2g23090 like protein [Gautieria morchelliformis]
MGNVCVQMGHIRFTSSLLTGAKAQQKRERAGKGGPKEAKSSLKVNEQARNIQCTVCKQTFLVTTRQPALEEHASNRHSKTLDVCFPTFGKA